MQHQIHRYQLGLHREKNAFKFNPDASFFLVVESFLTDIKIAGQRICAIAFLIAPTLF